MYQIHHWHDGPLFFHSVTSFCSCIYFEGGTYLTQNKGESYNKIAKYVEYMFSFLLLLSSSSPFPFSPSPSSSSSSSSSFPFLPPSPSPHPSLFNLPFLLLLLLLLLLTLVRLGIPVNIQTRLILLSSDWLLLAEEPCSSVGVTLMTLTARL